jgi:O-antigen/teichoic acid export membrane protein
MPKTESEQAKSSESTVLASLLRNTVQQGLVYLIGVVVIGLASFFVLPIYARIFTPAEYGLLSLAILLVSVGSIVIGNWLATCTTRFLPYYQRIGKTDTFYSTILLSMALSLAGFIILGIPAYFLFRGSLASEFQRLIPLVAVIIPLTMLFQISLTILRVKQEAKRYVTFELVFTYVALIIGVPLAVYLGLGVSGILWGQVIILFILGTIMFRRLFLTGSNVRLGATSLPGVKEFAFYGFPAAASTIGTWILIGADRYIIEVFRGTAEVGLYSMGYAIGDIIFLLVNAFILAAVPTLMLTYESDNREITSLLLSRLTRIFIMVGLPLAVGISVFASPIIRLLTTAPYYSASTVVPFIALGNFTYGLCLLSYIGLQTAKKTPIMARNWLAAAALNILLNIIFVPKFGFIAAAVTTLVSYAVLLILNIKSASKYLKWTVMPRPAFNSALASIIMGGAIFLVIRISSSAIVDCILAVITGTAVYLGMLVLLKELSKEEISQVIGLVKGKLPWAKHS